MLNAREALVGATSPWTANGFVLALRDRPGVPDPAPLCFEPHRDGSCTIGMERSLFGYSIFTQSSYRLETAAGKITAMNVGGWIGRLPVHPAIMKFGDIVFADLWFALDREHKLMGKMAGVNFHDGGVTITPPSR